MALETYHSKRNFEATPEPRGSRRKSKGGNSFVVQKHDARRLHYDFRLEKDGVLLSWAVTRGPSLVPGDKRLAVHVEDHPLDYGEFEGTIPKGEYGGGTVLLWDRGTWKPIGDPDKGLKKGHLEFELDGEKLHGRWHLVRMPSRRGEKRENWLLIKGEDEFARSPDEPDLLEERPESVKTGREIEEIAGEEPGWSSKTGKIEKSGKSKAAKSKKTAENGANAQKKTPDQAETPGQEQQTKNLPVPTAIDPSRIKGAKKSDYPGFVEPELATLKAAPPLGERWVHEIKFDGYRLQAHLRSGQLSLLTRTGLDWTKRFGTEIPEAFTALPASEAIIDGELVVENSAGATEFALLQSDLSEGRTDRFVYYAFDLIYLDGYDLRDAPLVERKAALEQLLSGAPAGLRYSAHFDEEGEMILRHACRLSLEGLVSKVRDSVYRPGRSKEWIKSKCSDRQEFVVGGYVPSSTSDKAIGSLVLGHYENGKLVHAGRTGTGFTNAVARDLYNRLEQMRREDSPFSHPLDADARRGVRWVDPELVAEVEFRNWTADARVRHAAFRGLREDKPAHEIVREDEPASKDNGRAKASAKPPTAVKLTHPDRVYWQDAGVTKEGLADYYTQVWRRMAPFVVARPLALVRCPDGTAGQCFFQKHAWKGHSKEILTVHDPKDKSDEPIIAIDSLDGLIGLVQGGVLEIHTWQSSLNDLERPDQIVMDLDPGEGVAWTDVIAAAREVRERLKAAGLESFVKTSGGKGLHVVSPLKPSAGWDEVKGFAKGVAEAMATDDPDRYVATVTKSKRRGKILVDYLRNGRGATAVAPYSTRARAGAPVSMPLAWDELDPNIGPAYFTVNNAVARVVNLESDPWEGFRKAEAPLPGASKGGNGKGRGGTRTAKTNDKRDRAA